jgi:hypothetical protein
MHDKQWEFTGIAPRTMPNEECGTRATS